MKTRNLQNENQKFAIHSNNLTISSAWFVRAEMGHSLEFSNGELILVGTSLNNKLATYTASHIDICVIKLSQPKFDFPRWQHPIRTQADLW